jgi:hypothetical protein
MEEATLLLCLWGCRRNKTTGYLDKKDFRGEPLKESTYHQLLAAQLLQEMRLCDPESHFRYLRMTKNTFELLLSLVGPLLRRLKHRSSIRAEIAPAERLALTLRYLATGKFQVSLSFNFRSTVCNVLHETCCNLASFV